MKHTHLQSCHLGPEISPEQFIPEHFFLFVTQGSIAAYDGQKNYTINTGDYCLALKNHLVRYTKKKVDGRFEKVIIVFDEAFLKAFMEKHPVQFTGSYSNDAFAFVNQDTLIKNFIQSLEPYYNNDNTAIDAAFVDVKREELLLILLNKEPRLADTLFNFAIPQKIDLEAFMNQNFRFNISLEQFALLTGRSLSTFKRDFKRIFQEMPGRWLIKKRLNEAHFLLKNEGRRPTDIYLDLGFEDLSHFSFAFKKQYGIAPSSLIRQ